MKVRPDFFEMSTKSDIKVRRFALLASVLDLVSGRVCGSSQTSLLGGRSEVVQRSSLAYV